MLLNWSAPLRNWWRARWWDRCYKQNSFDICAHLHIKKFHLRTSIHTFLVLLTENGSWSTIHLAGLWFTVPAVHSYNQTALHSGQHHQYLTAYNTDNLGFFTGVCFLPVFVWLYLLHNHKDRIAAYSLSALFSVSFLWLPFSLFSLVTGGSSQLSVSRTGRQQLSLPKSLWQLPPLFLFTHRWGGRAQVWLPQEKTVS